MTRAHQSQSEQARKDQSATDIFTRLEGHGINYEDIVRIVRFTVPQATLFFAQWFKGRTMGAVLKHFEKWRAFLKKDFILSLSSEVKVQVEQFVFGTELQVWQAIIEANPQVGPWDLQIRWLPTGQDENGHPVFIHPDREIVAIHCETKETRSARLPGGASRPLALQAQDHKQAFQDLGLWDQLWKGDPSRILISNRSSKQGWPVFTRFIIPPLYEFMWPHYKSPGHYSAKRDGTAAQAKGPALLPKALLQDMLEILKMEHDWAFDKATLPQLKAILQRYLAERAQPRPSK